MPTEWKNGAANQSNRILPRKDSELAVERDFHFRPEEREQASEMPLSNELKLLRNAPLPFLKKYWVSPSSQYSVNQLPDSTNPAFYSREHAFQGQKRQIDGQVTMSQAEHKIAYANLLPGGGDSYALHCYNTNQLTQAQKQDLLPIWYLPWWEDRVTKMRILKANQMPGDLPNPSLFFTSALTGCSIFVKGPADSPTAYHAGFDSNRDYAANPKQDPNSIRHWQILFDRYSPNTPGRGEANKGMYLADFDNNPDLQVYLNYLKTSAHGNMEIRSLIGEGNVFGVRDNTCNWTFYLQEVVTVQYRTFTVRRKMLGLGAKETIYSAVKSQRRPMCLREIFPNGNGAARIWNTEPVRI